MYESRDRKMSLDARLRYSCLALLIALFCFLHNCRAEVPRDIRTATVYCGFGPSEVLHAGVSVQLNPQISVGPTAGWFLINSHRQGTLDVVWALGIRGSYFLNPDGRGMFLGVNNATCDLMYLTPYDIPTDGNRFRPSGIGIEMTVGHDCALDSGVGIYWGAGFSASFHHDVSPMLFPALKVGLHIDL